MPEYSISLKQAKELASAGEYSIIPVSCSIMSDVITPIELMRKLKKVSTHCYMLESAQANEYWGRYTFMGYDPKMAISCKDGELTVSTRCDTSDAGKGSFPDMEDKVYKTDKPWEILRDILSAYKSPDIKELPPFTGGLVGYFSFDYFGYCEPEIKRDVEDSDAFKDLDLMLFDRVIAFDNVAQKIVLIVNAGADDIDTSYEEAVLELKKMKELILFGERSVEERGRLEGEVTALFSKKEYCDMVEKAKGNIREGDIFQIVLSNRLSAPFNGSLLDTYRVLRTVNPSPYMFYFSGTDVEVAGASPETLVKLRSGVLHTFPLAGTRPRGKTKSEDEALEKELLADEKELAEHNMLVDLGRNDLGKISEFGSVEVEKLHSIERYSHVMHIGSTVRGSIKKGCDALDAINAVLPAGTLSGAPKIRACQLIGELENNKRGIYGGAVGYIDFAGNMDTCIAIRLVYKKNDTVYVRSGAGIVADSDPEKEYQECLNKARASLYSLELSQEVD